MMFHQLDGLSEASLPFLAPPFDRQDPQIALLLGDDNGTISVGKRQRRKRLQLNQSRSAHILHHSRITIHLTAKPTCLQPLATSQRSCPRHHLPGLPRRSGGHENIRGNRDRRLTSTDRRQRLNERVRQVGQRLEGMHGISLWKTPPGPDDHVAVGRRCTRGN